MDENKYCSCVNCAFWHDGYDPKCNKQIKPSDWEIYKNSVEDNWFENYGERKTYEQIVSRRY